MPIQATPWISQRSKGNFISDRIQTPSPDSSSKAKGSGNQRSHSSKPQSPAVQALKILISNLSNPHGGAASKYSGSNSNSSGRDEGCFCLAQVHKLSPYVSICQSCGLILCELNQPYRPCPYKACGQPLLSPQGRAALIDSLNEKVTRTLEEEVELERKQIQEEKRAAGAFPELRPHGQSQAPGGKSGGAGGASSGPTHKVLSLTQKGAVLTTVRKISPSPSPKPAKVELPPVERRVPAPPDKPSYQVLSKDARAWENPRAKGVTYVPLPKVTQGSSGGGTSKRRRKAKPDGAATQNTD